VVIERVPLLRGVVTTAALLLALAAPVTAAPREYDLLLVGPGGLITLSRHEHRDACVAALDERLRTKSIDIRNYSVYKHDYNEERPVAEVFHHAGGILHGVMTRTTYYCWPPAP